MIEVKVNKVKMNATLPVYMTPGSAGCDVIACLDKPMLVEKGQRVMVPDASSITLSGVTTKVLKASITVTNGLEASNVLGDQFADDVVEGKGEVSGEVELYFSDRTHYDMFVNETEFPIVITLTRGADITKFTIPKAKFSGNRDIPVSTDKALIATYSFKGIQDATINGAIKIEVTNANNI